MRSRCPPDSGGIAPSLDAALAITGVDKIQIKHRPRLLSDNGSAYVSGELRDYLDERKMTRPDGATSHLKRDFAAGI